MEDAAGALLARRLLGEVAQMGDDVVPGSPLELRHPPEVEPAAPPAGSAAICALGDRQPELALALGEGDQEFSSATARSDGRRRRSAPSRGRHSACVERVLRGVHRPSIGGGL